MAGITLTGNQMNDETGRLARLLFETLQQASDLKVKNDTLDLATRQSMSYDEQDAAYNTGAINAMAHLYEVLTGTTAVINPDGATAGAYDYRADLKPVFGFGYAP